MSDVISHKTLKAMLGAVVLLCLGTNGWAQEEGHLFVRTVVQKEQTFVNDDGETEVRLVVADTVVPGEKVVVTTTFQNISDDAAENVVITNPISTELIYVEGSAFGPGADIEFSVDGGKTFGPAAELTVSEDGVTRSAGANDFTHIRWVMREELAAGAQGVARFSAVLE